MLPLTTQKKKKKKKKERRREFESLINLVRIITIERNLGIKLEYSLILYCTVN